MTRLLSLFRPTLLLTPEMRLEAVIERGIAEALQQRREMRLSGFVRPYKRRVG